MNDAKLDELNTTRGARSYSSSARVRPLVVEGRMEAQRHVHDQTVSPKGVSHQGKVLSGLPGLDAQRESRSPRGAGQDEVREAVVRLNEYVQSIQRDLTFEYDETADTTVIKVMDRHTGEMIRQIPDELALKLARNLHQDEPLTLFNAKV